MKKILLLLTIHCLLPALSAVEGFTASAQQVQWTTTTAGGDTARPAKATQGVLLPFLKFPDGSLFTTSPEQPLTFTLPLYRQVNTVFSRRVSASDSGYVVPLDFLSWNTAYSERNQWDGGAASLVPAAGRASLGLGSAALKDSLDFARAIHSHGIPDITALQDSLSDKYTKAESDARFAPLSHLHGIDEVTALQDSLSNKYTKPETNALLALKQSYADTNTTDATRSWVQSQSYLTGNQTITLSGDVSGSGTTAITTTVADDSHSHGIATLAGIQDSLNARVAKSDSLSLYYTRYRSDSLFALKLNASAAGSMAFADSSYWRGWIEDSLANKSQAGHTHDIGDVAALQDSLGSKYTKVEADALLGAKADTAGVYSRATLDDFFAAKSDTGHTHVIADVVALEDSLAALRADIDSGGGGGAPTDAAYVVTTANGTLTNEVVVSKIQEAYVQLPVQSAKLPTGNFAQIDAGENNWRLLYDAGTEESALWQFIMPQDYGSSAKLRVLYSMTSATSGGVRLGAAVMAVTPGDAADINTDSYDTENEQSDTGVPGTAGYLDTIVITLTNMDGAAAGDVVKIKLARKVAHADDNAAGDAEVVGIIFEYAKQ